MRAKSSPKAIMYIDIISGKKLPDRNFYLLVGSDSYTFFQLEKIFVKKFLSDDPSLFNRVRIECNHNTKAEQIINACEEYPFGSQYRLVIAFNVNRLKASEGEKIKKYTDYPAETTVLVMTEDAEELKQKSSGKFHASRSLKPEIKKNGLLISCKLNFRETRDWAKLQFHERGREIDSSALNLLIETVGNNLWDLSGEIEKVLLYLGDGNRVRNRDIEAITSHRPSSKIFNLTEKVGSKDISTSIKILDELLRERTPAVMVLTSLNNHFTFLYRLKEKMDEGNPPDQIAKKLHRHPFYVKKSMPQARNFSEQSFDTIFDLLARADGGLKSGLDSRNVLELTLIQICRQKG